MTESVGQGREDIVWPLARNIVKISYRDLSPRAVEATKQSILDTLGVIEAASGITPGLKDIAELVKEEGGRKESTILGFGGKVPAHMAAFANGAMVHCLDYDDIHHYALGHPSANTVPSGFAVAERLGKVSGRDLITAIALGIDLSTRFCYSISLRIQWHKTPLFGVFAAAATSGKLLGLSEQQMVDALGLAFCQAAGTMELRFGVDSDIGGMANAFSNKGGVLAALMAQRGIRGVRSCLQGRAGLFNAYFNGEYDEKAIMADLGKKLHGEDVGFKPWPACAATHIYIDMAAELAREHDIQPTDVESITVYVGDFARNLCEPLEARRRPASTLDAKFSIPYTIGTAIARRKVMLKDFAVENLKDPIVLEIAARVNPVFDSEYDRARDKRAGKIEIRTKNGQTYTKRLDFPYGHPKRPMTWDDTVGKFRDCVSYAARPIPEARVNKVIAAVKDLDNLDDAGAIMRLLTP